MFKIDLTTERFKGISSYALLLLTSILTVQEHNTVTTDIDKKPE